MGSAWQILHRAGLPLFGRRTGPVPDIADMARAVLEILDGEQLAPGPERDALAAFLLGWHHEWPTSFAGAFGADAERVAGWAAERIDDRNRYIKLRRIAIANLAHVL